MCNPVHFAIRRLSHVSSTGYGPHIGITSNTRGRGTKLAHERIRAMTLNDIAELSEALGFDPMAILDELLAFIHEPANRLALLTVVSSERGEDSLQVA